MSRELRILLVGAGHMGRLHAQKVAALAPDGVELRAVADLVPERAQQVAAAVGATGAHTGTDFRCLLGGCDAAIVAVPTAEHHGVVEACLDAGCDVLVEKPIAATLDEAHSLLERSGRLGRVLQVGHLEWFNAAMQVVRERITRPRFVEAHRLGPFSQRASDIDVVRDLMIHDIEILQRLLGEEPEEIDAVGIPVLSEEVDIANARLRFASGCVANLTASRVSATPMRKLRFFQRDGYFSIDFLAQKAVVIRREGLEGAQKIEGEEIETSGGDSLLRQLESFVGAVRARSQPVVDPQGGVAALRTALRVREAMPSVDDLA